MKKILKVSILLICIFLVTGCLGTKKLTCTLKEEEVDQEYEMKLVYTYKKNKLEQIKLNVEYIVIDDEDLFGMVEDSYKELYDSFEKDKGVKTNIKTKNNKLTLNLEVDVPKLSKEVKDKLDYNYGTYDEVKEYLESNRYTCK